jgi:hypothetical protein
MLLRYLGCPEDRMRSAFSAMDAGYGKMRQQAPPIDRSKISQSDPVFSLKEKGAILVAPHFLHKH